MKRLLKPEEVAERLAVSPKMVRAWLRDGKLPGVRLGRLWRVDPDALERFIQGDRTPSGMPPERSQVAPDERTRYSLFGHPYPTQEEMDAEDRELARLRAQGRRVASLIGRPPKRVARFKPKTRTVARKASTPRSRAKVSKRAKRGKG